jgi:hypothetical protein
MELRGFCERIFNRFLVTYAALYTSEVGIAIGREWVRTEVVSCDLAALC